MNKNTLIITIIALIVVVGGTIFFLNQNPSYQKESLIIESDLTPIELTPEEQQALREEGLQMPSEKDTAVEVLQSVRSSDELDAIEADLNETDLSALDAELDTIENDPLGL